MSSVRWWEQLPGRGFPSSTPAPSSHPGVEPAAAPAAFVSHASVDQAVAREVCAELEGAGLRCWVSWRDIPPSAEWAQAVVSGLQSSRVVVVLLSVHSVASDEVRREIDSANAARKPVVPVKIDGAQLQGALAYYLASTQWIDVTRRPVRRHLNPLVEHVRSLAEGARTAPAPASPPEQPSAFEELPLDALTRSPRGSRGRRSIF